MSVEVAALSASPTCTTTDAPGKGLPALVTCPWTRHRAAAGTCAAAAGCCAPATIEEATTDEPRAAARIMQLNHAATCRIRAFFNLALGQNAQRRRAFAFASPRGA